MGRSVARAALRDTGSAMSDNVLYYDRATALADLGPKE
jgi:hypothetical protein